MLLRHYLLATCLLSLLFTHYSHASNQGRWYHVEVLIFERLYLEDNEESLLHDSASFTASATGRSIHHFSPSRVHKLAGHKQRLANSGAHRVLFYRSWKQQMWRKNKSLPVTINTDNGRLHGDIAIHIGRYLHVHNHLWLDSPNYPGQGYIFTQKRSMKSRETHYLDHPKIGMLVHMTPAS